MDERGVYLISRADGLYKIGCTTNLNKRLAVHKHDFQDVRLIAFLKTNREKELERRLHGIYSTVRYEKEWFKLSITSIDFFIAAQNVDTENLGDLLKDEEERMYKEFMTPKSALEIAILQRSLNKRRTNS